jgi:ABC-type dipeptide/oligopeptide/nickel transport system permease component
MKTLRIFLQFLFVVANVVAVVLLIVSAYSDRVSPETSMTLSYLGLAFPVLCVVNLCFIIYWLFCEVNPIPVKHALNLMGMEVLIDRHILLLVMLGARETLFSVSFA